MREFQRKQRIKKRMYSLPALIVLLAIAVMLSRGAYGIWKKKDVSAEHLRALEEKVEMLSERESELRMNISRLETEEGIYEEIRQKFNVSEEGEHMVIIVDEEESASSTGDTSPPWYKNLWDDIMRR